MNVLFFTEISPFPINGGERIRSYGLLKALSELGHNVEAIINNSDQVDLEKYFIKNVIFIEYSFSPPNIFEKITGLHYFNKKKTVINIFNQLLNKGQFDVAFLDYGFIGQYIKYFKRKRIPVIYGTHNSQSNLTKQAPQKNLIYNLRKYQDVLLQKIHERYFFPMSDILIVVSKEDKIFHSAFCNFNKIRIIPNFLDENRYNESFEKEEYFIISANFGAYMNFQGLDWFITKVWDEELDSKCKLLVVGKLSIEALSKINETKKYSNIIGVGKVEDMNPYIGKAKAALMPLLHGSGTRLKCLEAMALKTAIVSTTKGAEGIESKNIIIIDNPKDFKKYILEFKFKNSKGEELHKDFLRKYSVRANLFKIQEIIESL